MGHGARTRALYNGDCPVCNAEMCSYDAYSKRASLDVAFEDLNTTDLAPWGVTRDQAARLLHVMHDGQVHAGFPAFLILWSQMPRYRWLARAGAWPVVNPVLDWGYRRIVAPIIYRRDQRRRRARLDALNT